MEFLKKNHFTALCLGLLVLVFGLMNIAFYFTSFHIVPDKLKSASSQLCADHLEDKSYQIKQLILENINNSKLWLANRQNSFFDSRWFAISYYENNGKEWLLKDFKINPIVLNVYKLNPSDYIKTEQTLVFPHPQSEQLLLQETSLAHLPLLVMDVPNLLPNISTSHFVRIHLFSDIFESILKSNQRCQLDLLDNRGNFVLNSNHNSSDEFLTQTKKIFKNILIEATPQSTQTAFRGAFLEIFLFNFIVISLLIFFLGRLIYQQWINRIVNIKNNIPLLTDSNTRQTFEMGQKDELSPIEEELAHSADEIKKRR